MKHIPYRQNPTVIDISKKSRPPPGKFLPMNMNYLINWILLTIPLRLSAFYRRAHFVFSQKFFWEIPRNQRPILIFMVWGFTKGDIRKNHPLSRQRKEVRTWTNLIVPNGKSVVLLTAFANGRWRMKLWTPTGTQSSGNYARFFSLGKPCFHKRSFLRPRLERGAYLRVFSRLLTWRKWGFSNRNRPDEPFLVWAAPIAWFPFFPALDRQT